MERQPKRSEYKHECDQIIHVPTGTPIWIPCHKQEGKWRDVAWYKKPMQNYDERALVEMGADLLLERGH